MAVDERIRRFNRAALGGDPQSRARLLRERLRTGGVSGARLRLAAYLGCRAAQDALMELPLDVAEMAFVRPWVEGLARFREANEEEQLEELSWAPTDRFEAESSGGCALATLPCAKTRIWLGYETVVRLALAAARQAVEGSGASGSRPELLALIQAATRCALAREPNPSAGWELRARAERCWSWSNRAQEDREAIDAAVDVCVAIARLQEPHNHPPEELVEDFVSVVLLAAEATGEWSVRAAIRAELVPWVLGERDPLAERVALAAASA